MNPSLAEFQSPEIVTKNFILSFVYKPFDPSGVVCPATLKPRITLKFLWKMGVSWGEFLSGKYKEDFLEWLRELPLLVQISIPLGLPRV